VERTPDTPNALVDGGDGLAELLVLLAVRVAQHLGLFADTLVLQVLDANGALGAVDVVSNDDGVLVGPGRDGKLDRGVALCEGGQRGLEEGVHAARRPPPVAVVKFEPFALQHKGADAWTSSS
jgi:hypothetical protein